MTLLQELRKWRDTQARSEGVETFRVFPNAVLESLAQTLPQNKEEMLCIKGLKDAKFRKYGLALLGIIKSSTLDRDGDVTKEHIVSHQEKKIQRATKKAETGMKNEEEKDYTLSVSQFLDGLNVELSGMASRVQGEISSIDERERVIYFTLKDSKDESTLNCLIFRFQYDVSGVKLAIGDEVVIEGAPDIYKPSGRLSMKVSVIELSGVGALQKAYEELHRKLLGDGLFAPERKRPLPVFPERIALVTSEQGAAIGDFTMNLGAQGFKVHFFPTSVEGKKAVFEIMSAVKYFNRHPEKYDVLVIVRGGGSLESLQAFNNEALVREIASSKIPTLLGVGHEKDVTLSALASDMMVSTPTATAKELRFHFDEARQMVHRFETQLPLLFKEILTETKNTLETEAKTLLEYLQDFQNIFTVLRQSLREKLFTIEALLERKIDFLTQGQKSMENGFLRMIERMKEKLDYHSERLKQYDPARVLKLGYSIVKKETHIIKSYTDITLGEKLSVELGEGKATVRVEEIFEK